MLNFALYLIALFMGLMAYIQIKDHYSQEPGSKKIRDFSDRLEIAEREVRTFNEKVSEVNINSEKIKKDVKQWLANAATKESNAKALLRQKEQLEELEVDDNESGLPVIYMNGR